MVGLSIFGQGKGCCRVIYIYIYIYTTPNNNSHSNNAELIRLLFLLI